MASRFSVHKASRFIAYSRTISALRQTTVVALFPVPGLLIALALALIPLQHPSLGPLRNWASFIHVWFVHWVAGNSAIFYARAVSEIPHREYSSSAVILVGTLTTLGTVVSYITLGLIWRFPIPFYPAFGALPYSAGLMMAHAIVFRGEWLRQELLVEFISSLLVQFSQLTVYILYSAVFIVANDVQQVVLVLLFPCLKYAFRRAISRVSRHLREFAQEIAYTSVEICASIYQATIMQSTPSALVTALIIGIDIVLNILHIKWYTDRSSVVETVQILARVTEVLGKDVASIHDGELTQFATPSRHVLISLASGMWLTLGRVTSGRLRSSHSNRAIVPLNVQLRPLSKADKDKLILAHALEILQATEVIVLVEYLEVVVPVVKVVYLVVASRLPSAAFNTILRPFHDDQSQLGPAVASIMLYTSLQGLTFIGLCAALWVRYRISALTLLAFVLETHVWSLQGKLIMWLVTTFGISIAHYGTPHPTVEIGAVLANHICSQEWISHSSLITPRFLPASASSSTIWLHYRVT
jgi:hypothetical protein